MSKLVTLRIEEKELSEVKKSFPAKTQTESLLRALKKGVKYSELLREKMIADYSSISEEEIWICNDSSSISSEIFSYDEEEFLLYSKYITV